MIIFKEFFLFLFNSKSLKFLTASKSIAKSCNLTFENIYSRTKQLHDSSHALSACNCTGKRVKTSQGTILSCECD